MGRHAIRDDELRAILANSRRIAVLGASARRHRASYRVADYLARNGYLVVPVNPRHEGEALHGHTAVASLTDIAEPVDLIDVFRRSEHLPGHLDAMLAMRPLPRAVWFQLGVHHDEVAARLRSHGITVVQDRCAEVEHRRLLGPVGAEAGE